MSLSAFKRNDLIKNAETRALVSKIPGCFNPYNY